ncbi:unnamed protein product [Rhizophagus irregularis]|nr:unnamed protein product [Rhizophagus irregularis]
MTHSESNELLDDVIKYDRLELDPNIIGSGGSASVRVAYCNNTLAKFAVKIFNESSREEIIKEIKITKIASHHPNIIRFYGITKLQGKPNYSLVLEYANGGTLRNYLRTNIETFKWEGQFQFAKEIASAVSWLHHKKVIHGDINPNNVLIHQQTIRLADFGCSRLQGDKVSTRPRCTIPYVDPNFFYGFCDLTEKSDIYSLALVFWELTSCSLPFDYETKKNDYQIMLDIYNGIRENPIPNTNIKFVALYQKCWKYEPNERPDICEVISDLNSIDPIKSENNELLTDFDSKESEKSALTKKIEDQDLSNCEKECDLNSGEYQNAISHL